MHLDLDIFILENKTQILNKIFFAVYKCDVISPGDFMSTARIIVCFSYLSLMKKTLLFLYRLLI